MSHYFRNHKSMRQIGSCLKWTCRGGEAEGFCSTMLSDMEEVHAQRVESHCRQSGHSPKPGLTDEDIGCKDMSKEFS